MARIPQSEPTPVAALFNEPDHEPELATQRAYESIRTDPWLGVDDEPLTIGRAVVNRQGSVQTYVDTDPTHQVPAQYVTPEEWAKIGPQVVEQAVQERRELAMWMSGRVKGPRPATPAIDALEARPHV